MAKNMLDENAATETVQAKNDDVMQRDITDSVLNRVSEMESQKQIKLPAMYNVGNALKSAWLKIQTVIDRDKRPALTVCTKISVANALLDMCIQGLTPAKNQCYFIVRGDQLTLMRSYFGTCAVLKRLDGVEEVFAQVVYEGDAFEYAIDKGNVVITKHEQSLANIDISKIVGAYSVIIKHGVQRCEIMTIAQIKQSWTHTTNGGGVQREYPDQMAKRTVINRGAKMYVNTSDDSDILIEAINNTTSNEYENDVPAENGDVVMFPEAPKALPEATEQRSIEIPAVQKQEAVRVEASDKQRRPGF